MIQVKEKRKRTKLKNSHLVIILIILFIAVFLLQYYCLISYIKEMFRYTSEEVRNNTLNNELKGLKTYFLETLAFLFFQSLGMLLCLNIGLLYFNIGHKIKELVKLVLISLFAIVFYQLLILIIIKLNGWTFTIGSIYSAVQSLSLSNYTGVDEIIPWAELPIASINLKQLLILLLLSFGVHRVLKLNYKRALSITARTYGLCILLWLVFSMIMEMNFS